MKKKKIVEEAAHGGTAEPLAGAETEAGGEALLARLGAAFLARLNVPEGMTAAEAVEAILSVWEKDELPAADLPAEEERAEENEESAPEADEAPAASMKRLPRTLRGGLGEAPEADYESMSAEQFRRLKKQLQRAAADGRRIRL